MAAATLTAASNSNTFTTVPGTTYVVGITGNLGGASTLFESANSSSSTVFSQVVPPFASGGHFSYTATGVSLRATALSATSNTSINVEVT